MTRRTWAVVLPAVLGCGAEGPAPERPTWVADVAPILRANCFQCHGPTADLAKDRTRRWDVPQLGHAKYLALGLQPPAGPTLALPPFLATNDDSHFTVLLTYLEPEVSDEQRMPPPPATRLSARDLQVLQNWRANKYAIGSHSPNHKPTIGWMAPPRRLQVYDEDRDQVLGKLECAGREVPILRTGGLDLPEGVSPPCTATLFDGFDETVVELM